MKENKMDNDINNAAEDLRDIKVLEITNDIEEIELTSKGEICYSTIIVKPRNRNLTIEINDLKINAKEQIAIDFRGGLYSSYKSVVKFKGDNEIISENNITICISNNQTVEICGEDSASLKVVSGKSMPTMGSNEYTAGAGHVIFSKGGNVYLEAGHYVEIASEEVPWSGKDGAYGLGFYNEDYELISSIEVLDEINLSIKAEKGESIKSISYENKGGNGGAAIKLDKRDTFKKEGNGYLKLIGGKGGNCIGEYCCGKCGDGGAALEIGSGEIIIKSPALLKGGDGGSFNKKENYIMAKGGKGGDGIYLDNYSEQEESKISIEESVEIIGGSGGNSSFYLNDNGITAIEGGNGGSCLKLMKAKVKLFLEGEIKYTVGIGGKGSCEEEPCIAGTDGQAISGENIEFIVPIIEDTYEEKIFEGDQKGVNEENNEPIKEDNVHENKEWEEKKDELAVICGEGQGNKRYNIFLRIIKKIFALFKL